MKFSDIKNDFQLKALLSSLSSDFNFDYLEDEFFILYREDLSGEEIIRLFYFTKILEYLFNISDDSRILNLINKSKYDIYARVFDLEIEDYERQFIYDFANEKPDFVDMMIDGFESQSIETALDEAFSLFKIFAQNNEQLNRFKDIYNCFLAKNIKLNIKSD